MSKQKGDNVSDAARRLASFVQRLEKLDEEKTALSQDISEVKKEAKSAGFDMKVLNEVLKRRKKGRESTEEFDALLATYETSLDSVLD